MTTDHAAIVAAEARLAEAQADVERLRAQLAAEQTAGPRLATAADGVAMAQRRHPGRTRSELAKAAGTDTAELTGAAAGIAEARRRAALRGNR
ncbi:hypothetical protein [Geodermatophilus sp. URMC 62]|uniref:hypothetical protein n=1 Tax=Geodermatophilus sp. URMC 62 TaxID=3423414 RepID=UPI00406CD983